jgi:uncharacterized surface anchored protein
MSNKTQPGSDAPRSELNSQQVQKGVIKGTITYPWGAVRNASVKVGETAVTSDRLGKYELPSLEPGLYKVEARAPFPGYETSVQEIKVEAGQTRLVDIHLEFEKAVVKGHVRDMNGKPIAGATLSGVLYGKDMQTTRTNDEGYFEFEKVTPGNRFIRVNAPGYMAETQDFEVGKNEAAVLELRMQPASCKIYGSVRSGNGKTLQAEILLMRSGIVVHRTKSDPTTGAYEFPVLPGLYEVNAMADGYLPKGWRGSASADTEVNFTMTLASEKPAEEFTH